jgi:hypothetical protein
MSGPPTLGLSLTTITANRFLLLDSWPMRQQAWLLPRRTPSANPLLLPMALLRYLGTPTLEVLAEEEI